MTTISARIVADSISQQGVRLTTMHLRYPRFIHAEVMTHRVFSRNARSSRAVPISKMIEEVIDDPVIPLHWGAAQNGMQAYEECKNWVEINIPYFISKPGNSEEGEWENHFDITSRENAWLLAHQQVVDIAQGFNRAGYHKQVVNRLLEPFMHIDVLVTATSWENFFALRDHHAAEPHIQMLSRAMKKAMADSVPNILVPGEWHLPYVSEDDLETKEVFDEDLEMMLPGKPISQRETIKLSVARCARISYAPFDGEGSVDKDIALADRLLADGHFSPLEHQAMPDFYVDDRALIKEWRNPSLQRNFTGWCQYRALAEGGKFVSPA